MRVDCLAELLKDAGSTGQEEEEMSLGLALKPRTWGWEPDAARLGAERSGRNGGEEMICPAVAIGTPA